MVNNYRKKKKKSNTSKYQKKLIIEEKKQKQINNTTSNSRKKKNNVSQKTSVGFLAYIVVLVAVSFGLIIALTPNNTNTPINGNSPPVNNDGGNTLPTYNLQYTLTDIDGATFSLNEYQGKILVLNFMGESCYYCGPHAENLNEVYTSIGTKNLQIIALDVEGSSTNELLNWRSDHGVSFPIAKDVGLAVASNFAFSGTPATFILDENGNLIQTLIGLQDVSQLQSAISAAINTL